MKLLQNGYPKSGNYWLYNILDQIYKQAGIKKRSFIKGHPIYPIAKTWNLSYPEQAEIDMIDVLYVGVFYRVSSAFKKKINDFADYAGQTSHVWSHSNYCERSAEVFSHFDKVLYIIRDPRDVLISTANFAFTTYMKNYYPTYHESPAIYLDQELETLVNHWSNHVLEYLDRFPFDNIYFIFYENLLVSFEHELENILKYLQIPLSKEQIKAIGEATNHKNMKSNSPKHVNNVKLYKWQQKLSTEQKDRVLDQIYPVLELLNYPINEEEQKKPHLLKLHDKTNFENAWKGTLS